MDIIMTAGCLVGGLVGLMLSFYLALCFICWAGDVIENKKWRGLWD